MSGHRRPATIGGRQRPSQKGPIMELILLLVLPLPLGFLIKSRVTAYLVYVGVHSFVFTFQTLTLTRAWVGGNTDAFEQDPNAVPWPYAVVNLVIYGIGLG